MEHDNILKYFNSREIKVVEFENHILLSTGFDWTAEHFYWPKYGVDWLLNSMVKHEIEEPAYNIKYQKPLVLTCMQNLFQKFSLIVIYQHY